MSPIIELADIRKTYNPGTPVAVDEFVESDVILPPDDSTMKEVEYLFSGEGAIPG